MDSMANSSNKDAYDEVFASLEKHNKWFENSIPLIASENIPSPAAVSYTHLTLPTILLV